LGYIIDNILEEHANILQSVISNIKNSQPVLDRDDNRLPPCPSVLPTEAEKLNVGSTGQLKPNLNDPRSSLREALHSIPDLVDLVNSVADDLGVDLEQRPSASDDEVFRDAPYESKRRESRPGVSSRTTGEKAKEGDATEDKATDEESRTEDCWLKQTRRCLTELSEARERLMGELDEIAGELDGRLKDTREDEQEGKDGVQTVQRVLSQGPIGLSRKSTWDETTPDDLNTTQNYYYEDVSSAETMQPLLDTIPIDHSRTYAWQQNESIDAAIEDPEANRRDDHKEDAPTTPFQRVPSREPIGVLNKLAWSTSKPVSASSSEPLNTVDASTDQEQLTHAKLTHISSHHPNDPPCTTCDPYNTGDVSQEEI
jgi:hypothetical protein